jgi:hypothetical protein
MDELISKIKTLEVYAYPAYVKIVNETLENAEKKKYFTLINRKYRNKISWQPQFLRSFSPELQFLPDVDYQNVYEFLIEEELHREDPKMNKDLDFLDKATWAHHWLRMSSLDEVLDDGGHLFFKTRIPPYPYGGYLHIESSIKVSPNSKIGDLYTWTSYVPNKFLKTCIQYSGIDVFERLGKAHPKKLKTQSNDPFIGLFGTLMYNIIPLLERMNHRDSPPENPLVRGSDGYCYKTIVEIFKKDGRLNIVCNRVISMPQCKVNYKIHSR